MIIDANILVYAVDEDAPQHARAKAFLEEHLNPDPPAAVGSVSVA